MEDPILDEMFKNSVFVEEESKGIDPFYGQGRWKNALLRSVESREANQYGHSIQLKVDLQGEEGMSFTFFVEAPVLPSENGDPDEYAKLKKRYQSHLNQIQTLIHATGLWVTFNEKGFKKSTSWPEDFVNFATDEAYNTLVALFARRIGLYMGVNVKVTTYKKANGDTGYRKNVWGLDPKKDTNEMPF